MQSTKNTDLIGDSKFLPWRQLDDCSMTRPFLSVKGVACETTCTRALSPGVERENRPGDKARVFTRASNFRMKHTSKVLQLVQQLKPCVRVAG